MGTQDRARRNAALGAAREAAYRPGEFVGQENFMTAGEILALARAAGAQSGASVLDLCCGSGGPALHVVATAGCRLVGLDRAPGAVRLAQVAAERRDLAHRARFLVADAARLPLSGPFDAALLLETMLAIENKPRLLAEIGRVLRPGGRLGLTLEEGEPLSAAEQRVMPGNEPVWLCPEDEFLALLETAGFGVCSVEDHTATHAATARRLLAAFSTHRTEITACLGEAASEALLQAHAQWVAWLSAQRVRKLAVVAVRGV